MPWKTKPCNKTIIIRGGGGGGAGVIHVIRDLPNMSSWNVIYIFVSTWNVIGGTSVKRDVSFIICVVRD